MVAAEALADLAVDGELELTPRGARLLGEKALTALRTESLAPEQTTQSLQENKEWLKEKIR